MKQNKLLRLNKLLPLVAIGTVADCQSIIDSTNRNLVKAGIQIIQSQNHGISGINELLEQTGTNSKIKEGYKITSQDLGFLLSPLLNSSGRISHARLSIATMIQDYSNTKYKVNLVTENQEFFEKDIQTLSSELIQTNTFRKESVKDILGEVEDMAQTQYENGDSVLWLEGDWNKGIIGLLASKLVNQYNLPVVVVSTSVENSKNQ
jgi:single-stranded-DNA-specific exonuclease